MTREEAIEWMQEEKASFERAPDLNGCPMTEYWQKATDVYDMAISALRQQDHFREVTKKVEPLTLDELRSAYKLGCPVWLVGMEDGDGWVFIHHVDSCSVRYARIGTSEEWCFRTKSYGVRVWAYRQKPEEDVHA